ncbi:MAG: DivIVA domain-containing protein [Candidatus Aegiribacteria sp.]|nr:DivIVA domain-containing protein [Candidatus Aegiribacteria sp.]
MRITPLDIRRQNFRKTMRGYDVDEVEAFLEMVASAWEELVESLENAEKELIVLRARAADFDRMEGAVRDVLVQQQQSATQARKEADREAELIIMDAEIKASNLVSEARERVQVLTETIRELQDRRLSVLSQIRSFVDSHRKMLDLEEERIKSEMIPDEEKLPGEEDGDSPMLELTEL